MKATKKAPQISDLRLFDSCVTLGRMARAGTPMWLTPENILSVMDKYDISEALVHHTEARMTYPRSEGNRRLLKEIEGMSRLHPVWVLEPPASPDPRAARDMVEEMVAAGVKVARLMMGVAPPLHWLWKDLCEALEEHKVPCFLDFAPTGYHAPYGSTLGNPDDWAIHQLREICLAHPKLPLVLSHISGGLGIAYSVLPLMRRVPNLSLDITGVMDHWRKAAAELGPERVFFASGMPFYDPAILVSNVQYAHEITDDAKRKICGDNLRRLMEVVR
jgi:predicted TIM-barrel fold metal-dependent hydrolase